MMVHGSGGTSASVFDLQGELHYVPIRSIQCGRGQGYLGQTNHESTIHIFLSNVDNYAGGVRWPAISTNFDLSRWSARCDE